MTGTAFDQELIGQSTVLDARDKGENQNWYSALWYLKLSGWKQVYEKKKQWNVILQSDSNKKNKIIEEDQRRSVQAAFDRGQITPF